MFIFQWLFLAGYCDDNWHWLRAGACLCAITILILSLWLSQNLLLFNHSPALAGNCLCFEWPLPLAGCAGCSLGWGYCADRLDLDDLQAPTVAAKALGRTLHVENFSELIWKFEPVRIVRIILFDSVTWGWFPLWAALWAALCFTLPPKLPPRNGSERFWTIVGVFTHGVWARLDQLLGVFCVFYCCLKWFSRLQSTWEGPEEEGLYNTKKKRLWNQSWRLSLSKALCLLAYFNARELDKFDIEAAKLLAPCQTLPPYLHCCRSHDQTAKPHVF